MILENQAPDIDELKKIISDLLSYADKLLEKPPSTVSKHEQSLLLSKITIIRTYLVAYEKVSLVLDSDDSHRARIYDFKKNLNKLSLTLVECRRKVHLHVKRLVALLHDLIYRVASLADFHLDSPTLRLLITLITKNFYCALAILSDDVSVPKLFYEKYSEEKFYSWADTLMRY